MGLGFGFRVADGTATDGTATDGTATDGTATDGTATDGTATAGTATAGSFGFVQRDVAYFLITGVLGVHCTF